MTTAARFALAVLFAGTLGLAAAGTANAAGDARRGAQLAQAWCTGCHVAGDKGTDMAPPFGEIVKRPGRDESWFYAWLSDPHPPMPRLELSRRDIGDLIAYLIELQAK